MRERERGTPKMDVNDYLLKLERNLMLGGGRWVADFNESFWGYPLGDLVFDMFVTATVRPKGFFLSRVAAWLTTPNYHIACFAYSKDPELKRLNEVLRTISTLLKEQEFAWAWLVIPNEGPFSRKAESMVQNTSIREIGIALVDVSSQEIVNSESHWGRRMIRFIRCFK
ncbi:MAG TPA: hypothetical protein VMW79_01875 [Anaerolineae bacterium]|nr:hypothetical protein [Anaerolineae bacterium]